MIKILAVFGLFPAHSFSLLLPVAAIGVWLLFLPFAYLRRIKRFYTATLRASILEEVIFRGFIFGSIRLLGASLIQALIFSSLLFGIFHMRNLWWAGWRRSWRTSVYAGLVGGPLFGIVRILSGDIYLGILMHFMHNLLVIFPLPGTGRFMAPTPKDQELLEAQGRR